MNKAKMSKVIIEYMLDVIPSSPAEWKEMWKDTIDETAEIFVGYLKTPEDVEGYLNFILRYIDSLNKFFKKKKSGYIPYSRMLHHAKKKEKIMEYLFDVGAKKKLSHKEDKEYQGDITLAGFHYEGNEEDASSGIVIYKENVYHYIYNSSAYVFFFNKDSLIVQASTGRIRTYSGYKKRALRKNKKFIKRAVIYKYLNNMGSKKRTVVMNEFMSYYKG